MRRLWVLVLLCGVLPLSAQTYQPPADTLCRVAFWNLENLFYPGRDSLNPDTEYTPDGIHRWTRHRYRRKLDDISRALTFIGGWQGLDLIGLAEVENDTCLIDLTRRMPGYGFVQYDSPDRRGIDCALLYRTDRLRLLGSRAVYVPLDSLTRTRDILYVCLETYRRDTLHLLVCHLPSQWGGRGASEWKRRQAKQTVQMLVDSLYAAAAAPRIIVMGDMNCAPEDDIRPLRNLALQADTRDAQGTHCFRGHWMLLDQFYVSPALADRATMRIMAIDMLREYDCRTLNYRPRRTFLGPRYHGGVSDHYPVLLEITNPKSQIINLKS